MARLAVGQQATQVAAVTDVIRPYTRDSSAEIWERVCLPLPGSGVKPLCPSDALC